ncbi:hypothetical protein TNCV_2989521 [Trichonephila clavipes]|nr:hypothetical protein TNCV_2989521 [Trichonephila clavipes]
MIVQFRNEKVSNHGSIPITIDCNVVAFIVFEEWRYGEHQAFGPQVLGGNQALGTLETWAPAMGGYGGQRRLSTSDEQRSGRPVSVTTDMARAVIEQLMDYIKSHGLH